MQIYRVSNRQAIEKLQTSSCVHTAMDGFRPPEKFDRTLRSHGTVPIQHVQECSQTSSQRPPWAQKKVVVRSKYRTQFMLSAAIE